MIHTLFNEASLSRVHEHAQNRNIGMIAAHRGNFSAEENAKRNGELGADIRKAHGYIHVRGKSLESGQSGSEHCYLVMGKKGEDHGVLKKFLTAHGQKYDQESILYKAHNESHAFLHGTTTRSDADPQLGQSKDQGVWHPNRVGTYFLEMTGRHSDGTVDFESIRFLNGTGFFSRQETEF